MTTDLALLSASELLHAYAAGTASPVEATTAALARIDRYNDRFNAFRIVDADAALASARASEARWAQGQPAGLVDGVPTTIKDLNPVRGWSTRRGSRTTEDSPAETDAPLVARLREQGAVLLGKTTTPEYGWKGVTDSPLTGIARNPWNPEKTPGGSSGGAAVAAAAGMGALHQGSDGGGSIRIPAGFTGIYGIKPTFGRVPNWPPSAFGTLSHQGPMTRTVADAALMLTVMAQPDPSDWHALPENPSDWRRCLGLSMRGWRIAFSADLGHVRVDPEIADLVRTAAGAFAALGAHIEEDDPGLGDQYDIFRILWYTGAARMQGAMSEAQLALLDPGFREVGLEGAEVALADYLDANAAREAAGIRLNLFFDRYDLLLTPTLPMTAFEAGEEVPVGSGMERWPRWTPFSYPFNLSRHPAATIPCGVCSDGLPAGLQIIGPMYREDRVLAASRAYETVRPVELPDLD